MSKYKDEIDFSLDVLVDNSDLTLKMFMEREDAVLEALGNLGVQKANESITRLVYDTPQSPNYTRTGNLRNSLTHYEEDDTTNIGSPVKYAPYVELGTINMKPRPFLKQGIMNNIGAYQKVIKEGFGKPL